MDLLFVLAVAVLPISLGTASATLDFISGSVRRFAAVAGCLLPLVLYFVIVPSLLLRPGNRNGVDDLALYSLLSLAFAALAAFTTNAILRLRFPSWTGRFVHASRA